MLLVEFGKQKLTRAIITENHTSTH